MRWYVSRNGETVGPVEESQIHEWIRAGMSDGHVRREDQAEWLPIGQMQLGASTAPVYAMQPHSGPTCQKCGSMSFTVLKQGYSGGKGCCGALACGPIGLLCGTQGANKVERVCNHCGTKTYLCTGSA